MWRTIPVVVLVGSFIGVVGCQNKSLVDGKPKPPDPLLMSKKPVEGRPATTAVAATVPAVDVYGGANHVLCPADSGQLAEHRRQRRQHGAAALDIG